MSTEKWQAKRKAHDLELPERGRDAAERKRVLNVLAQRRYRQRKREHVQKLEARAQAGDAEPKSNSETSISLSPESHPDLIKAQTEDEEGHDNPTVFDSTSYLTPTALEVGQPYPTDETNRGQSNISQIDPFAAYNSNTLAFPMDSQCFWDTSVLLPSLPSTPLSSETGSSSNESTAFSLTSLPLADELALSAIGPRNKESPPVGPQDDMQYSFPDEVHLEVLELTLLRGCMTIAKRLNIDNIMWSLSALSPFADPSSALDQYNHLPVQLQPTMVQMTVPHHPVADLLPWPAVRDRLILILSQPPEMRPPQAASPTALIDFVYDLEDSAEGVRISGSDPYSATNWEVGEKVFKSWWWILDRDVIRRSNELRASRGAPMLGASTGSVLGELV